MIIKEKPEDFLVEEIAKLDIGRGDYLYFLLEKKNWTTKDAIKTIAKKLGVNEKRLNIAGIKDKKAVTKQYVSVFKVSREKLEELNIPGIKIDVLGYGKERLKLGQLYGNRFEIKVKKFKNKPRKIGFLENYFDDQRFGGKNSLLGKALVKKEFSKACAMLRLKVERNDYVGALRKVGKRLLRFYINAYQSLLFNEAAKEYLKKSHKIWKIDYSQGEIYFTDEEVKNIKVPIVGFLTELKGEFKEIYRKIMEEEGIKKEDFLIKPIPEIASEGNERDLIVEVKGLEIEVNDKEATVKFELPKGSYATLAVRKMFRE